MCSLLLLTGIKLSLTLQLFKRIPRASSLQFQALRPSVCQVLARSQNQNLNRFRDGRRLRTICWVGAQSTSHCAPLSLHQAHANSLPARERIDTKRNQKPVRENWTPAGLGRENYCQAVLSRGRHDTRLDEASLCHRQTTPTLQILNEGIGKLCI